MASGAFAAQLPLQANKDTNRSRDWRAFTFRLFFVTRSRRCWFPAASRSPWLPLLVVYFHRFSLSGLVLNIGVSAIMAVLIFTGMAGLLAALLSTTAAAPLFELTRFITVADGARR